MPKTKRSLAKAEQKKVDEVLQVLDDAFFYLSLAGQAPMKFVHYTELLEYVSKHGKGGYVYNVKTPKGAKRYLKFTWV